jgi:hypothetical protein
VQPSDLNVIKYSDHGVDFFGSAVVTTQTWLATHGEEAKAFLRCTTAGIKATLADQPAAIESLRKRNSMLDDTTAKAVLAGSLDIAARTPNVQAHGLSYVTEARLKQTLEQATSALGIPMPDPHKVWNPDYLPPRSDQMLKK